MIKVSKVRGSEENITFVMSQLVWWMAGCITFCKGQFSIHCTVIWTVKESRQTAKWSRKHWIGSFHVSVQKIFIILTWITDCSCYQGLLTRKLESDLRRRKEKKKKIVTIYLEIYFFLSPTKKIKIISKIQKKIIYNFIKFSFTI